MKYNNIVKEIKTLSQEQQSLKPQRKTKNFKGNRTVDSYTAVMKVYRNKYRLMHLYLAYARLTGIEIPYPKKKVYSTKLIDQIVEQYSQGEKVM